MIFILVAVACSANVAVRPLDYVPRPPPPQNENELSQNFEIRVECNSHLDLLFSSTQIELYYRDSILSVFISSLREHICL